MESQVPIFYLITINLFESGETVINLIKSIIRDFKLYIKGK